MHTEMLNDSNIAKVVGIIFSFHLVFPLKCWKNPLIPYCLTISHTYILYNLFPLCWSFIMLTKCDVQTPISIFMTLFHQMEIFYGLSLYTYFLIIKPDRVLVFWNLWIFNRNKIKLFCLLRGCGLGDGETNEFECLGQMREKEVYPVSNHILQM